MQGLLRAVFNTMAQENITYCLMRDANQLDQIASEGGEIDLLVEDTCFRQVPDLLAQLGFVRLPAWGYTPHHFFIAYDYDADCWLKLDIVTEVVYGKPVPTFSTTLAHNCFHGRRRCGSVFIPSPEDEFVTLLLHCVLDKGRFTPSRRQRLQSLRQQIIREAYLTTLLKSVWSPLITWSIITALLDTNSWEQFLSEREAIEVQLSKNRKINRLAQSVYQRAMRKLSKLLNAGRLRPPLVAVLAPDGAGKSTLAAGIQKSFYFPVRSIYMGLYQKGSPDTALRKLPGVNFARRLLKQWRRYLEARYHQARGRLIIFDRYGYDALLPSYQQLNWAKRLRRRLLAHACPPPDLIIILDAPGTLLFTRKGEHNPTFLERQRQAYLKLGQQLPQTRIVDAAQEPETVRREVISLIWRSYLDRAKELESNRIEIDMTVAEVEKGVI